MHLYLLSENQAANARIEQLLDGSHTLEPFDKSREDLQGIDAVCIVEPYIIKGEYLSLNKIWHNYLHRHYPDIKLIVLGFETETASDNYISLLDLHTGFDWKARVERALPARDLTEGAFPRNGYGLVVERLQRFFTGHNSESIIDAITKVRLLLNNAELSLHGSEMLRRGRESFALIWQKYLWPQKKVFQQFYSRWDHYKDYLDYLPFYNKLTKADIYGLIQSLSEIFTYKKALSEPELKELERKYRKIDPFNRISDFTAIIRYINENYVHPRTLGDILIIDDDMDFHRDVRMNLANFRFHSVYAEEQLDNLDGMDKFHIILLDLDLRGDGTYVGLDWIKRLKKLYPDSRLVIASNHSTPDLIDHAIGTEGADFFLAKENFNAEKWTVTLFKLFGGRRYSPAEVRLFNYSRQWEDVPTILIVEDEDYWYQQIEGLSKAYQFVRARTTHQAREQLQKGIFDLIIVDLIFKVDGVNHLEGDKLIDLAHQLQEDVPVIATSIANNGEIKKALGKVQYKKFLAKEHFHPEKWLEVMQTLIEAKRLNDKAKYI